VPGSAGVHAGGRPPQGRSSSPGGAWRAGCSGWCSSLVGSILLDPLSAGAAQPGEAGAAGLRTAAVVLVVGGDVPDRGVQPDGVVLASDPVKLAVERGRVAESGGCGQSPFRWLKKLSTCAWSVGVPGRP
jgi:hypothetical protein